MREYLTDALILKMSIKAAIFFGGGRPLARGVCNKIYRRRKAYPNYLTATKNN